MNKLCCDLCIHKPTCKYHECFTKHMSGIGSNLQNNIERLNSYLHEMDASFKGIPEESVFKVMTVLTNEFSCKYFKEKENNMKTWKVYYTFNMEAEHGDNHEFIEAESKTMAMARLADKLYLTRPSGCKITDAELVG